MVRRLAIRSAKMLRALLYIRPTGSCPRSCAGVSVLHSHPTIGTKARQKNSQPRQAVTLLTPGRFHVDEEKRTLTHTMFISLFPNWIGQTQPRVIQIEGDFLPITTENSVESGGKLANPYLRWKRATAA